MPQKSLFFALFAVAILACAVSPDDVTVYMTNTGTKYHVAGCGHLAKSKIPVSLSDAIARGLTECSTCGHVESATSRPKYAATVLTPPDGLHFVRVNRVVDGDTIDVVFENRADSERVRLIGVNTPETKHPQKNVEFYGKEASDFTTAALSGRQVWLQFDLEVHDKYQRLLGYVWTEKPNDVNDEKEIRDKMFNARLLLNGYGQVMTIPPNSKYANMFVGFQREARQNNRGLWVKP